APVAFILGASPGVGYSVAHALKAHGYKVALGSRHPHPSPDDSEDPDKDFLRVAVDVGDPASVKAAFEHVRREMGVPSVVVHNVSTNPSAPNPADPLSLPYTDFAAGVATGAGVLAAAQHALAGFRSLKQSDPDAAHHAPKVFITTGNIMPFRPAIPLFATLAAQKKVSAHVMELCAGAYASEGFRFYFASQVNDKGGFPGDEFNPRAHAVAYWDIISLQKQGRWDYR
ncbi:hypothetical protein GLOTRDRAFT_21723, partial [Gloeophyllum trabeum ATCC 11539]